MTSSISKSTIKSLFLLDGIGALLSAFLLGVVLVHYNSYVQIPIPTLYFLAALPCLFALYDFYCYFFLQSDLSKYLRIIAIINILYCVLSLILAFYHIQEISYLGWIYIIGEIIIVVALAAYELKISSIGLFE